VRGAATSSEHIGPSDALFFFARNTLDFDPSFHLAHFTNNKWVRELGQVRAIPCNFSGRIRKKPD
jgi:hypothetical protein